MHEGASSDPGSLSPEKTKEILMRIPANGCRPAMHRDASTAYRRRAAAPPQRGTSPISPERP